MLLSCYQASSNFCRLLYKTILVFIEGQNLEEICFEPGYCFKILMSRFFEKKKSLSARVHILAVGLVHCQRV